MLFRCLREPELIDMSPHGHNNQCGFWMRYYLLNLNNVKLKARCIWGDSINLCILFGKLVYKVLLVIFSNNFALSSLFLVYIELFHTSS
jgi:hypothetical protein